VRPAFVVQDFVIGDLSPRKQIQNNLWIQHLPLDQQSRCSHAATVERSVNFRRASRTVAPAALGAAFTQHLITP
jgi:hypothetical protein